MKHPFFILFTLFASLQAVHLQAETVVYVYPSAFSLFHGISGNNVTINSFEGSHGSFSDFIEARYNGDFAVFNVPVEARTSIAGYRNSRIFGDGFSFFIMAVSRVSFYFENKSLSLN